MFAIMLKLKPLIDRSGDNDLEATVCDLSPGAQPHLFSDFMILGYRPKGEAEFMRQTLAHTPRLWQEIVGERSLYGLTVEDATKILTVSEEYILKEIVSKETEQFKSGDSWYDGISWIPKDQISSSLRERAYQAVYTALLARGRQLGYPNPDLGHQGNGRYYVYNRESPVRPTEIPAWPVFPPHFIHRPNLWGDEISLAAEDAKCVLIEVETLEDEPYYVGVQDLCDEHAIRIMPTRVRTKQVLLTEILDLEVIIFASRQPDKIDPLPCRLVDVVPFGTGFDPEKVTRL